MYRTEYQVWNLFMSNMNSMISMCAINISQREICDQLKFPATDRIKLINAVKSCAESKLNQEEKHKVVHVVIDMQQQTIFDNLIKKKHIYVHNLDVMNNALNGMYF